MKSAQRNIIIAGVIIAGGAAVGSLFLFFPDMMLEGTSFDRQMGDGAPTDTAQYGGGGEDLSGLPTGGAPASGGGAGGAGGGYAP